MESYLGVTYHYTDSNTELGSVVLGVSKFPKSHTADNIKEALSDLISDRGLTGSERPPPPPPTHTHMIVKHFGCTAIHNKALYKCIFHSFILSFIHSFIIYLLFVLVLSKPMKNPTKLTISLFTHPNVITNLNDFHLLKTN